MIEWAVVAALAGVSLLWAREQGRARRAGWRQLAAAHDLAEPVETGSWLNPGLAARAGDLWVRLEWYGRDWYTNKGEEAGYRIVIRHVEDRLGGLELRPEGAGTALEKALPVVLGGTREVEVGDQLFDGAFYLGGAPARVFAVLDGETRSHLLRLGGLGRLALGRGELSLEIPQDDSLASFVRASSALGLALDVARRLCRPGSTVARLAERARADPSPLVRVRSLLVLMREFGEDPAAREAVVSACSDPSPEVRLRAASARGGQGVPTLVALAEDTAAGDAYAAAAVSALGRLLTLERTTALLERSLRERRTETARACVDNLGAHGAPAVGPLARVLALRLDGLAEGAARALGATGSASAEPALLAALADPRGHARVAAVEALGRIGTAAAVLPLKEAMSRAGFGERALARELRQAVARIQSRLPGASPGQLSLATGETGQLSLAEAEIGRLSLAEGEPGALSLPRPGEPAEEP